MHRSSIASFLCLPLAVALVACSKEEPKPAEADSAKGAQTETAAAPEAGAAEVSASPTPAKPDAPAEPAVEPSAPSKEPEVAKEVAAETPEVAAKTDDKAAATTEESAAESKKPSKKKKSDDKAAEAPAKETKPKFTELGIQVTKTGSGTAATVGKHVTIHYKASIADAEKPFDSTFAANRPLEIDLGVGAKMPVIEGLRRGLEGLMPGSEVRLQIPASLAWGEKGSPAVGVPANTDVVFEVQVLDVQ